MKLYNIENLLKFIATNNSVKITQIFSRKEIDCISVRCLPMTQILELTFISSGKQTFYTSTSEAAMIIDYETHLM